MERLPVTRADGHGAEVIAAATAAGGPGRGRAAASRAGTVSRWWPRSRNPRAASTLDSGATVARRPL